MEDASRKIFDSLARTCSRQECCSRDMLAKALKRTGGDETAAREIVDALIAEKYVDDSRYAAAFAREKSAITGWGPVKITFALAAKGISRETAAAALQEVDSDRADDLLRRTLEAKWRTLQGDPQGKLKLIRFALSRGYEYDRVQGPVEEICKKQ